MGISIGIDFKVIETKQGSNSYPTLVGRPWGQNMKANILVDKDKLEIKGKGKNITIPLDPQDGMPWQEPNNHDIDIFWLYQVIYNKKDMIDPNKNEEIYLGFPMFVGQYSGSKLYNWKIKNNEILTRECWSMK